MERLIVNTSDYWNGAQGSGWCTLDSSVHLAVMTVYINGKGGRCAVVPAPPANDLFFPHFHCDALWWTGVVVTNPNHQAVTAVLTAFDDVGTVLGTSSVLIQPKAKVSGRVDTLLGLTATKGWFTVSSQGLPIQGMAVYADRRASSPVNCAVSAVVPSDSFAFSLFRNDPNWWTGMALANPNDVSEEILLTATNSAGVSIDTVRVALPAKGRLLTTVSQLFSLGGAAEGWISVDASSRPVAGVQVIRAFAAARDGSAYAPEGLAMVEGQDASSSLIFCQSEQWPSDLWTELALTNPVLAGNSLGFQVVENPGTPSHLASRNLSPNQSWVEYVLDLLRRPN